MSHVLQTRHVAKMPIELRPLRLQRLLHTQWPLTAICKSPPASVACPQAVRACEYSSAVLPHSVLMPAGTASLLSLVSQHWVAWLLDCCCKSRFGAAPLQAMSLQVWPLP